MFVWLCSTRRARRASQLNSIHVAYDPVTADADLRQYELLIIGKAAMTPSGPVPDIRRVRDGLKVIVFEQTSETLEQRLGFRVQEYGLRNVFPRVPDHPYLAGLDAQHLRDWRGERRCCRRVCSTRPANGTTASQPCRGAGSRSRGSGVAAIMGMWLRC